MQRSAERRAPMLQCRKRKGREKTNKSQIQHNPSDYEPQGKRCASPGERISADGGIEEAQSWELIKSVAKGESRNKWAQLK